MKTMVCGRWNRFSSMHDETRNLHKIINLYDACNATEEELIEAENGVTILLLQELEKRNITIIGDGSIRWDSVFDVTRHISGCTGFEELILIPGTNHFYRQPHIDSLPLCLRHPILSQDFNFAKKYTKKPLAFCLPGPYSTARQTQLKNGIGIKRAARAYAEIFNVEIAGLLKEGVELVRIEEPQIIAHPEDFKLFKDIMGCLLKNLDTQRLALVVWFGDVTSLPGYFNLPFGFFFLDFVCGRKNIDMLEEFPSDAHLIAGIFDARSTYRESDYELRHLLKEIISRVPRDRIILSANTDFHFLPWDEAMKKVEHMAEFAKEIESHDFLVPKIPSVSAQNTTPAIKSFLTQTPFPTSVVGSFPQTDSIRKARLGLKREELSNDLYRKIVNEHIHEWMDFQKAIGITVPVSGEFLREDMAAYFGIHFGGKLLDFVPSYENRRYRPVEYFKKVGFSAPILVSDFLSVQSLSDCYVKETITGPATLADWALTSYPVYYNDRYLFRRDLARALRVEIEYLSAAGVKILQIDEPALTHKMENFFMDIEAICEAVHGFEEKIYLILHICYSDMEALEQVFPHILKLPFHQIHMEMANRKYSMVSLIEKYGFGGKDIGLGVIDVHTDRIETVDEILLGVKKILPFFRPEQIWLTPDCGLKERSDAVAKKKLRIMTSAAEVCREKFV